MLEGVIMTGGSAAMPSAFSSSSPSSSAFCVPQAPTVRCMLQQGGNKQPPRKPWRPRQSA